MGKLASLDTFMKDISTGLDAEVPEGPEGKDNLMKVFFRPIIYSELTPNLSIPSILSCQ